MGKMINFVLKKAMHTVSKQQISHWVLLDYQAQRQLFEAKINFFKKKYNLDFQSFERQLKQATTENFEAWDDSIEWKAYEQFLSELLTKIEDIKHGNFQVA